MKKLRYMHLGVAAMLAAASLMPSLNVWAEETAGLSESAPTALLAGAAEETGEDTEAAEPLAAVSEDEETGEKLINVVIKSVNPGYSSPYVGESIELARNAGVDSKVSISLAGLSVIYTPASTKIGNDHTQYAFLEGNELTGESLLLRLKSSTEVKEAEDPREVADAIYPTDMARANGILRLEYNGEVIEEICWGTSAKKLTGNDCYAGFDAEEPTSLVRDFTAEETEELFKHVSLADYTPTYDPENPGLKIIEPAEETIDPVCRTVEFSEILTYFETAATEQFIELYNRGEEDINLEGCTIRYKNKLYELSGIIKSHGFLTFHPMTEWGLQLTKNPTSTNRLELVDADGEVVDALDYNSGQKKGVALAMVGYNADGSEKWIQTYNPTPNAENTYQQFRTCPVGKVINLETGNCVNETTLVKTLPACPEGKYRNPLTGRCKSYATTASAELKPCAEGYERNPATGRCRKIVTNDGAEYEIVSEEFEEKRELVAIWAIILVIVAGVLYILFQYREEIREKLGGAKTIQKKKVKK